MKSSKLKLVDNQNLTNNQLLDAYQRMYFLRKFEENCGRLYGMGEIGGFCHLYIGQEAVVTAVDIAKSKNDSIITSYRDHAHAILSGIEPKKVMSELTGRATGCSQGKGGSMHMFNVNDKFFGGHGIVGAQVPIGTGIAFAEKYNQSENMCFTFLGDGAVNQGQVYEDFNMASLWSLPVIYVIENNEYSMGTSVARSTAQTDLYKKGESFGVHGIQGNGMIFEEAYKKIVEAIQYVKSKNKPIIVEFKTYRYRGHSMSDPGKYRAKSEVEDFKKLDPIIQLRNYLIRDANLKEEDINSIEKEI